MQLLLENIITAAPRVTAGHRAPPLAVLLLAACVLCALAGLYLQARQLRAGKQREQTDQEQLDQYHAMQSARAQDHPGLVASFELNLTQGTCVGEGELLGKFSGTAADFVKTVCSYLHPNDRARYMRQMSQEAMLRALDDGVSTLAGDYLLRTQDAGYVWRHIMADLIRNPQTDDVEAVTYAVDNNRKRRLEQIAQKLIQEDYTRVMLIDAQTGLTATYRRNMLLPEETAAEAEILDMETQLTPLLRGIMYEAEYRDLVKHVRLDVVRRELEAARSYNVPMRMRADASGTERHINLRFSYLSAERESILLCSEDVTQALFNQMDAQTGLLNPSGFYAQVMQWIAEHPGKHYTMLRYDFDGFKFINTTAGYAAGNKLLRDFGLFMHEHNTDDSFAGHLSADHFVRFCGDGSIVPEQAVTLFQERYRDYPYPVTLHVGVYDLCEENTDAYLMCFKALAALQTIKGDRTQMVAYYEAGLLDRMEQAQQLLADVERALQEEQFKVWFQPQYDSRTNRLAGAEALIRWQHPVKGMVSPGEFIPLLEHSKLITRVDRYVWERVCRHLRRWSDMGLPAAASVNISRMDLRDDALPEYFSELVQRHGLRPEQLRLEITESAYMDKPDMLIALVDRFRAEGFTVEMDDFGAGYSSLNTLKDIHIDVLKLDMKFLSGDEEDVRSWQILSSMVSMAHGLKMSVTAEGVETARQAAELTALGCDLMQGYYYGRPMPPAEFEAILRSAAAQPSQCSPATVMDT